jgi:PhnB protein
MAIQKLNPYLMFNGDARQAIELYERVLGARTEHVQRFGEVPGATSDPASKDRIIHALLRIGGDVLMLSDSMPDHPVAAGATVQVCLDFSDPEDMKARFEALGDGGSIDLPLHDTFWGATFGMLTDRHGIHWMFNCTRPAAAAAK